MKRLLLPAVIAALIISEAHAAPFTVSDIRVNGLQRVSAGSVFSALPLNVGETVDERSLAEIQGADLLPFQNLQRYLAGMMPAHVIYPQVDAAPAGFSKVWLQDILRKQLNYQGVLFSDDLSMAGAHVAGDAAQRVLAALTAGCNVGLLCNDRAAAEQALAALQTEQVVPCTQLSAMYGNYIAQHDFQQHPRWQAARQALKRL